MKELAPLLAVLLTVAFVAGLRLRWGQMALWPRFHASRQKRSRPLEVIALVRLSNQSSVHLVRARDKVLVLGVSNSAITVLESFPAELDVSEPEPPSVMRSQSW